MLNKKIIIHCLGVLACCYLLPSYADTSSSDIFHNPFYIGLTGGYGSTTWGALVPENQNAAISISTPTRASEGGSVWGVVGGYEFIPQFALEASYMRYPEAKLYFDPMSLFSFDYDGRTELVTHIETVSLMAKLMLIIPHTSIRVYSSAGVATVHRYDAVKNIWRLSPTFGAGLNYNFTDHWMGQIGVNYTAGYGKTELDPTKDYVPFLYSTFIELAYRF